MVASLDVQHTIGDFGFFARGMKIGEKSGGTVETAGGK